LHAPEIDQLSPLVSLRALASERPFTLFCMEIRAVLALSHGTEAARVELGKNY